MEAAVGSSPVSPQPPDPRRDPASLVAAVGNAVAERERWSVRATAVIVAAGFIILGLMADAVPALAFMGRLPWWLPPALVTAAAAVLVAFMPLLVLPRPIIDAWVTLTHLALAARSRWIAGGQAMPEAHELDDWLRRHAGPEDALHRAEALAAHGRLADVEVPGTEATRPADRFLRGQVAWFAAFARGDDEAARAERAALDVLLEEAPAGPERPESVAALQVIDALRAFAAGEDHIAPLAAARRDLGPAADGLLLRSFVAPRFRHYGRVSIGIFLVVVALTFLLGPALG